MRRRSLLAGAAATATAIAAPSIGRAAAASTIRFVPEADLSSIDPIWTTAYQSTQHGYLVYDTLWGQDEHYNPQLQMLESVDTSTDGRVWTLKLRPGLKFHDNEPVRAQDCVASILRWSKRDSYGQSLLAALDKASAKDDRTIVLSMKHAFPVADAISKTTSSVCFIMPERVAKTDPFKQITDPTGSGPFVYQAKERVAGSRVVYSRFAGYVPRSSGTISGSAGPKVAHFDRVEWHILPDPVTAVNALRTNEVDWVLTPEADLVDMLKKQKGVVVRVINPTGSISCMRFNWFQPPFDRAEIRRAFFPAIVQSDYMIAVNGPDRTRWNDKVGYFCPQFPMASDAGMSNLTGPRSVDAAKKALEKAGYKGEKVVFLAPQDVPYAKTLADVTGALYRKLGLNVAYEAMDWATLVQRRAKMDPVSQGGWSVFQTNWPGPDQANPAVHIFLRGNGKAAAPGWPSMPDIEALRNTWLRTSDLAGQKKIAREIQARAFMEVPYIPLGQMITPTAYRSDLTGMITGGITAFWNIRRG